MVNCTCAMCVAVLVIQSIVNLLVDLIRSALHLLWLVGILSCVCSPPNAHEDPKKTHHTKANQFLNTAPRIAPDQIARRYWRGRSLGWQRQIVFRLTHQVSHVNQQNQQLDLGDGCNVIKSRDLEVRGACSIPTKNSVF